MKVLSTLENLPCTGGGISFARKSEANFFSLDYERCLRYSTGIKSHFILSEEESRKDWRLFDLLFHSAWGALFRGNTRRLRRRLLVNPGFLPRYGQLKNIFCFSRPLRLGAVVEF